MRSSSYNNVCQWAPKSLIFLRNAEIFLEVNSFIIHITIATQDRVPIAYFYMLKNTANVYMQLNQILITSAKPVIIENNWNEAYCCSSSYTFTL